MARLPVSIDQGSVRGARASGYAASASGLAEGLQDLGGAVQQLGRAQMQRDDMKAEKVLRAAQAAYEPTFGQRAALYDGSQPGFASAETTFADAHFESVLKDPKLSDGVKFALRQRLDTYKAQLGQRAIGIETERRAGIVAQQERVKLQSRLSDAEVAFDTGFEARRQKAVDGFDGSDGEFRANLMAGFEEDAKAALDAAPDDLKPLLQARLEAKRVAANAQALEIQDHGHDAYVQQSAQRKLTALSNTVLSNPAAYGSSVASLEATAEIVPRALREKYLSEGRGQLAAYRVEGLVQRGEFEAAKAELADGRYDGFMRPEIKARLTDAVEQRAAQKANDIFDAMRFGALVDVDEARRAAKASGDVGLQAQAEFAAATGAATPEALNALASGGGKKGFAEAADFVIDQLEGGAVTIGNDNGRGPSRFGINQTANPDLNVQGLTRPQAVGRYASYWRAVGASRLPPGLAIAAFDAAVLFGPDDANAWVAKSGGDVGRFLALERTEMERLATADPAKYGDDLRGWKNRLGKVAAEAARRQAFANVQEGLATDPIKFALGSDTRDALVNVPPLPDDPSGPAFQQALQGRMAVGSYMARTYRAPLRLLTNAEAAQLSQEIDQDPLKAIDFAQDALAAVGPQGAKALLTELGQQKRASVTLHLADLSANGSSGFARQAARGLALRGDGVEIAKTAANDIKAQLDDHASAFAGQLELRAVVQQTAEAAYLADQQAGHAQVPSYYVNGALGATRRNGRTYGGVSTVNGAPALLPSWLAADHADEALEVLGESWSAAATKGDKAHGGPVYSDGSRPTSRDLSRMRLQLLPNGNYRLLDRSGAALMGSTGRAFELDMDAARPLLRARLGVDGVAGS